MPRINSAYSLINDIKLITLLTGEYREDPAVHNSCEWLERLLELCTKHPQ